MNRSRWLEISTAIVSELLNFLQPHERDAAFEELVVKVRTRRAKSRSVILDPPLPREDK